MISSSRPAIPAAINRSHDSAIALASRLASGNDQMCNFPCTGGAAAPYNGVRFFATRCGLCTMSNVAGPTIAGVQRKQSLRVCVTPSG